MSYTRRGMGFTAEEHGDTGETPPILAEPRPAYGTAPQVLVPPQPPPVPAAVATSSGKLFGLIETKTALIAGGAIAAYMIFKRR